MGGHHHHPHPSGGRGDACAIPSADGGTRFNTFSDHIFEYRAVETRKLVLVMVVTLLTMGAEIVGGIWTGSLALISDAGHMFTHAFAVVISLAAILIARNPPCHHRTYGLFRAEILAAFSNSLFLAAVTAWIVWESALRLVHPRPVQGREMLLVALFGLAVNLGTMLILHGHHRDDLNIRGVFLHLVADTLSSVAIVSGAALIQYTGWNALDPLISVGISLAILHWAWGLGRESAGILLEMAPAGLDVESVSRELRRSFPEIAALDNVHLWAITPRMYVFTAHLSLGEVVDPREVIRRVTAHLKERYPIVESTIEWV